MSGSHCLSSPIKWGCPPVETRKATEAYSDISQFGVLQDVDNQPFVNAYLSGCSLESRPWPPNEATLVESIIQTRKGQEQTIYAPLLQLLNCTSQRVFQRINAKREALVFYSGDRCNITNPFTPQERRPDIVGVWVETPTHTFPQTNYDSTILARGGTWCELAVVGEAKVQAHGKHQLASYLQSHLQLHPELNAVLGFGFKSSGYTLFYHDAGTIHRSQFSWKQPGPLNSCIEKLYTRPFQDPSMRILDPKRLIWAVKVGDDVYLSETPQALAGPGQRRFTTTAVHQESNEKLFIKDIWRDDRRVFFEGLLFDKAHAQNPLPGLMWVYSHGFVPDEHGSPISTTQLKPKSAEGWIGKRYKMRMITKDVGRPLEDVRSLRQFLCVMYDSCVVQRNLYRKCRILHRDISDANIMIAPDTDEYRQRCAEGYAAVKFVNQVLAKCKDAKPNPACLVIDLGNGADLKVERGQNELTVRTGTPKFIARSISCGRLLDPDDFDSHTAKMPSMEGTLGDYSQFMHTAGYEVLDASEAATQSQVKFTHRLFHDAESTFWVIAWALARSTGGGPEPEQGTHPYFSKFFYTMYRHHPEPLYDSREDLGRPSEGYWRSVLHPDLGMLARMLKQMFTYIRPEWGYRPELDPEHVHEALMRSLLAEIIRIDETGTDIPIAIGGRAIPPALGTMLPLSSSTMGSLSKAASNSQKSLPTRSEQNSVNGSELGGAGSSKKRSKSCRVEPQTPDISHGLQQLKLGLDVTTGEVLEQSTAQGVSLEWKSGTHKLLAVPLGERL